MKKLTLKRFQALCSKTSEFGYAAEASELGIVPGIVPMKIPVGRHVGNGEPLILQLDKTTPLVFRYKQGLGCLTLTVFND